MRPESKTLALSDLGTGWKLMVIFILPILSPRKPFLNSYILYSSV
jgi:hypothetical protein